MNRDKQSFINKEKQKHLLTMSVFIFPVLKAFMTVVLLDCVKSELIASALIPLSTLKYLAAAVVFAEISEQNRAR